MEIEWDKDGNIAKIRHIPTDKMGEAIELCVAAVKEKFNFCPVEIHAFEWDSAYGDILDQSLVAVCPLQGLYKSKERFGAQV